MAALGQSAANLAGVGFALLTPISTICIVRAMGDKLRAKIEHDTGHAGARIMVTFYLRNEKMSRPPA